MQTIGVRRIGMLLASTLGLLTTMVPSAQATDSTVYVLEGTMVLTGGMSYTCWGTAGPNTAKCTWPAINPGAPLGQTLSMVGGNTRGFGFSSSVCVSAGTSTNPAPPGIEASTCTLTASGVLAGSCGAAGTGGGYLSFAGGSGGGGGLNETTTLVSPAGVQTYTRSLGGAFSWIAIADTWIVTGTVNSGGVLVGVLNAQQFPTIDGMTVGNTCLAKTARTYEISGTLSVTVP